MKLKIKESSTRPGRITAENSNERREDLEKLRTASVRFRINGGGHLTSDDMIIGYEIVEKKENRKLESHKKDALGVTQRK